LYFFHKKLKILKNPKKQKKNIFSGFLGGFFWFFFGWVFYCQPWEKEEEEDDGDLSKYDLWGNEEEGGEDKNGKGEKEGKEAKKKKSRSRSSSR
jgi:hypothetical protein